MSAITKFPICAALVIGISLAPRVAAQVSIDYAMVGDLNNPASANGFGGVSYLYGISRNETTVAQYVNFLNAVAQTDTYSLYVNAMTRPASLITQSGSVGSFTYTADPSSLSRPMSYVSWFNAARFTNWLHNGQPTGAQSASSTEDGAYSLNGVMSGASTARNVGALVFLPSEDEWTKAAYYDPNKGGTGVGGYWEYATKSDTMTTNDIGVAGAANFQDANGFLFYTVPWTQGFNDVGAYGPSSASAYGTNDQTGNAHEWIESAYDPLTNPRRGINGGAWSTLGSGVGLTIGRYAQAPTTSSFSTGFRVATIPESSSLAIALLSGALLLGYRKRA